MPITNTGRQRGLMRVSNSTETSSDITRTLPKALQPNAASSALLNHLLDWTSMIDMTDPIEADAAKIDASGIWILSSTRI